MDFILNKVKQQDQNFQNVTKYLDTLVTSDSKVYDTIQHLDIRLTTRINNISHFLPSMKNNLESFINATSVTNKAEVEDVITQLDQRVTTKLADVFESLAVLSTMENDSAISIQTATVTRIEQLGNSIYDKINYQLAAILGLALTHQSANSTCNVTERPNIYGT